MKNNMETKHTKGEWFIQGSNLIKCNSEQVASANSMLDEYEANAKLIAAAPELLEVLFLVKHSLDNSSEVDRKYWSKQIEKAINKATK